MCVCVCIYIYIYMSWYVSFGIIYCIYLVVAIDNWCSSSSDTANSQSQC
jgi:hypothetical protein